MSTDATPPPLPRSAPTPPPPSPHRSREPRAEDASHPLRKKRWWSFGVAGIVMFGILSPLITIAVETTHHVCSQMFFDPIPTLFHLPLLLTVPLANLLLFRRARENTPEMPSGKLAWLAGFASVVALFYCLLFIPGIPVIAIGLAFFWTGVGLLALLPASPFTALFSTWRLKRSLDRRGTPLPRGAFRWGLMSGAVVVLTLFAMTLHRADLLRDVLNGTPGAAEQLKASTSEAWLKNVAKRGYQPLPVAVTMMESDVLWDDARDMSISAYEVAPIFYRLYGKSPGGSFDRRGRWDQEMFSSENRHHWIGWMRHGLELATSEIEGWVDADKGLGYLEWTQVITNDRPINQEGRQHIQLPAGGVVSRVTLWVNGEPREAAFETVSKARGAYESIVRRNRDPVLVNHLAKDKIQVECFPVPAAKNGKPGEMKFRLGITFPIEPYVVGKAAFELPHIVRENFTVSTRQQVAIESKVAIDGLKAVGLMEQKGVFEATAAQFLYMPRDAEVEAVACLDPVAGGAIVASLEQFKIEGEEHLAVVIDSSEPLADHLDEFHALQKAMPASEKVRYYLTNHREPVSGLLEASQFEGGTDAVPGLDAAARWLRGTDSPSAIVWLHGPQPFTFAEPQPLYQSLSAVDSPTIHALQLEPGGNKVLDRLFARDHVKLLSKSISPVEAVEAAMQTATQERAGWQWISRRADPEVDDLPETVASEEWAKLHGFSEIMSGLGAEGITDEFKDELAQQAIAYKLVTPVSAAIVLETRKDYERFGITPPEDQAGHSTVPEPSTALLVLLGLALLGLRRRRL